MSEASIEEVVCAIVTEALAATPGAVTPGAILMADLGAESLDFLDIVFKLEQTFHIQITRGEMERAARGDLSEDEFAPGGVLSEAGLRRLRELMPEAGDRIGFGLRPCEILGLFSVQTFANIVRTKLAGGAAPPPV
jgi:acyl carrier protein